MPQMETFGVNAQMKQDMALDYCYISHIGSQALSKYTLIVTGWHFHMVMVVGGTKPLLHNRAIAQ